jgi:hypothetical protein
MANFELKFKRRFIDLKKYDLHDVEDRKKVGKFAEDAVCDIILKVGETRILRPCFENIHHRSNFLTLKEFSDKFNNEELNKFYKIVSEFNQYCGKDIRENIPDIWLTDSKVFYEVKISFKIEKEALEIYKRISELTGAKIFIVVKELDTINDDTFRYCELDTILSSDKREIILPSGDEGYELDSKLFKTFDDEN